MGSQGRVNGVLWRRYRLTVQGLTFSVMRTASSFRGTPYVLVHGIGMSSRNMVRLATNLSAHGPVIVVEMPGHANLPRPAQHSDIATMGRALGAVLDEIGLDRSVLVGHSMGSQWTVELALARPDLVAGVVVIGPVADARRRSVTAHLATLAADMVREPPALNAIVVSDYARCGARWYLVQLRHMLSYPLESSVMKLAAPLLVIRGQRDPIATREWCRLLLARSGRAQLVEIPGQAHGVQHAAPSAVGSAILAHARGWAAADRD